VKLQFPTDLPQGIASLMLDIPMIGRFSIANKKPASREKMQQKY
jgi:hypothetical protein